MLIEAQLLWGEDVIRVALVEPRPVVRIVDLGLPFPVDGVVYSGGSLVQDAVVAGGIELRLRLVDRSPSWERGDLHVPQYVALAGIFHAAVLVLAFFVRATPMEEEEAHRTELQAFSAVLDAREHPAIADAENGAGDAPLDEEPGTPTRSGAPGTAGTATANRHGVTQRAHGHEVTEPLHDPRRREAALVFGMVGIINLAGGSSSTGKNAFAEYEGPSATGSVFGTRIEDAMGMGGATLSGTGEGGGGLGAGIGVNGVSGLCDAQCMATRGTVGRAGGKGIGLGGGHATKAPMLRCGHEEPSDGRVGCNAQVNGRLPPETVQRIVRQSFGRLRGCYEAGLRKDPSLAGRVAVKFVIDREGAVSTASAGEHDLRDEAVVSCVVRGFAAMSFPPPSGGIVTVVYPITFST